MTPERRNWNPFANAGTGRTPRDLPPTTPAADLAEGHPAGVRWDDLTLLFAAGPAYASHRHDRRVS